MRGDLLLRASIGVPMPPGTSFMQVSTWASSASEAWHDWVKLVKDKLTRTPEWPANMIAFTAMNPVWRKGKIFNPHAWEGKGPHYLDIWEARPETHRSLTDWRRGDHDHQTLPEQRPSLLGRIFHGALGGLDHEITLIEDIETAGKDSIRDIQWKHNLYTPDRPFPEWNTQSELKRTPKDVENYKKLFNPQTSMYNSQAGETYYKPIKTSIKRTTDEYISRAARLKYSNNNYFIDIDDPLTGWTISNEIASQYQQMPFYIYDIRNDRSLALPTSLRSVSSQVTPSWAEEETMGRIDDIPVYIKTTKEYNIDLVFSALSPRDYIVMWRKIGLLESFQFPQYNNLGVRINAPIVRLRLGDFIRRGREGHEAVAGYFKNFTLTTDETMTLWELEGGELVITNAMITTDKPTSSAERIGRGPRYVDVTFTFKVLHDSSYAENEDGSISFLHDAVYNGGYHASKLMSTSPNAIEPAKINKNKDVIKPLGNTDTQMNEAADDDNSQTEAAGDFFSPAFGQIN